MPAGTRAFHADEPTDVNGFLSLACVELLVHADDALQGLGSRLVPAGDLARVVLDAKFPAATSDRGAWRALLESTGRPGPPP